MSNPDPYLHAGLTPNTDVELYPSEASGGTHHTRTFTATATGTATVARVPALVRAATAIGTPAMQRTLTAARVFAVTATGVAEVVRGYTRSHSTTATGTATESHLFIPATTPEPFVDVTVGRPYPRIHEVHRSARCYVFASVDLTVDHSGRRHREDELLELALV